MNIITGRGRWTLATTACALTLAGLGAAGSAQAATTTGAARTQAALTRTATQSGAHGSDAAVPLFELTSEEPPRITVAACLPGRVYKVPANLVLVTNNCNETLVLSGNPQGRILPVRRHSFARIEAQYRQIRVG